MEEKLSDRAQVYWETVSVGGKIDADQLFENTRRPKDLGQDIRHIRGFLTRKFNDGVAFLNPGQSPPVYTKLSRRPNVVKFCTMIFNALPVGVKMTSASFNSRLPLKLQNIKRVGNFFHRAKVCGAVFNVIDEHGEKMMISEKTGTFLQVEKKVNITILPNRGRIPTEIKPFQTHAQKKLPIRVISRPLPIIKDPIESKIFEMKAGDVGMSIFELLHKLMNENTNQVEIIRIAENSLNETLDEVKALTDANARLTADLNKANEELQKHGGKDLTYAEIYKKI